MTKFDLNLGLVTLEVQRCLDCGRHYGFERYGYTPDPKCPRCASMEIGRHRIAREHADRRASQLRGVITRMKRREATR